jgi:glycerophosphoryl diester phosphodiesterase
MKSLQPLLFLLLSGTAVQAQTNFDLQGHRGCRGLMPENTIPAFLKAIDLGVTTLEMDAVISGDGQVVISHEPFMSSMTCSDSNGLPVAKDREKEYKLYGMTREQIRKFDCGSRPYSDFPDQQKIRVSKPLLSEVIVAVEEYLKQHGLPPVKYNIETKCTPAGDDLFHPKPAPFVDLLMAVINSNGVGARCIIQSFDVRTLQYLHVKYPEMKTALLIANVKSLKENLKVLGFTPDIYSPNYLLVNKKLIRGVHQAGMKILPWTINKADDMLNMKSLGVDGLITDFPDRFVKD